MSMETIRAVLSRDDNQWGLLKLVRKGEDDFYSYAATESSHRTYHPDGRTHTSEGKWIPGGDRSYHSNIRKDRRAKDIKEVKILQCLIIINDEVHASSRSTFKKYKKNKKNKDDRVNVITKNSVEDGEIVFIVSGIAKDQNQIEDFFSFYSESKCLTPIFMDIGDRHGAPSMFITAIRGTHHFNEALQEAEKYLKISQPFVPMANSYTLINGNDRAYTMVSIRAEDIGPNFKGFGPEPCPVNVLPPDLPIMPVAGDVEHLVELTYSPFENNYVDVGPLTIRALWSPSDLYQSVFVTTAESSHCSQTITFSNVHLFQAYINEGVFVSFQYGCNKGHREAQITLSGRHYQLEILRVSRRSLDDKGDIKYIYGVKIIELQTSPIFSELSSR